MDVVIRIGVLGVRGAGGEVVLDRVEQISPRGLSGKRGRFAGDFETLKEGLGLQIGDME